MTILSFVFPFVAVLEERCEIELILLRLVQSSLFEMLLMLLRVLPLDVLLRVLPLDVVESTERDRLRGAVLLLRRLLLAVGVIKRDDDDLEEYEDTLEEFDTLLLKEELTLLARELVRELVR